MEMYDVVYHNSDGEFTGCSIVKITLLGETTDLPEGSAIRAQAADGSTFLGCIDDYYVSEKEAITELISDLEDNITFNLQEIASIQREVTTMTRTIDELKLKLTSL